MEGFKFMHYFKIKNGDGKEWILPSSNLQTALQIYQPSGWKGKGIKVLLPYLHKISFIRNFLGLLMCDSPISFELNKQIEDIFRTSKLEYSWFGGTPNTHQKITIQIFKGKNILGYCKLSKSSKVYALFEREKEYLVWLAQKGVNHVPNCLYCGKIGTDEYMFVQTTEKTPHSKAIHDLGNLELSFLSELEQKTKHKLFYENSDQFKSVARLKSCLNLFQRKEKSVLQFLIEKVEVYYLPNVMYTFAAYHSDFTPWNMFVEDDKLFVFDFEYAGYSYMPYLDVFHYIFQTAMFEKGWNATMIYDYLQKSEEQFGKYFVDFSTALCLYLIDVIGLYAEREQGFIDAQQKIRLEVADMYMKSLNMSRY